MKKILTFFLALVMAVSPIISTEAFAENEPLETTESSVTTEETVADSENTADENDIITDDSDTDSAIEDDVLDGTIAEKIDSENPNKISVFPTAAAPNFTLSTNMKASVITPTVDFFVNDDATEADVRAELDILYQNMLDIGLNSVFINTVYDNQQLYSTELNNTGEFDPISLAIDKAQQVNIAVYLIYDVDFVYNLRSANKLDYLITETHKFALKYPVNGIVLTNYYSERSNITFGRYMINGAGIGYENWLYDHTDYLFKTVCDIIHITDNTIPVGLMVNDMWANISANDLGSNTADSKQALYDGFADTRKYIDDNYVDFAIVKQYGSLTDENLNFNSVAEWWGELCGDNNVPMYLTYFNEKIGTDSTGWESEDQLLKQLTAAKDIPAYSGGVFNSYQSLLQNPLSTTSTLTRYFNDNINEATLDDELEMQSPSQLTFTTYEPTVDFMGTFDQNFDVYFNSEKIKLNDAGYFYFAENLEIGANQFTIKHKGVTYTYNIERKIIPIKSLDSSIESGKTLSVNGGTKITLSAIAYKGAAVTALVNGEYINLNETSTTLDDDDVNTYYARFTGSYTVPAGIIGQEQNLGEIVVAATSQGYSRTLYGASVTVLAEPEPIVNEIVTELKPEESVGSGEIQGTIDEVKNNTEYAKYVKIVNNYTSVYDAKTTGAVPTPNFSQLPAGTVDYYSATSGNYYLTTSGKRINTENAVIIEDYGIGENNLAVKAVGTYGGDSYIRIGLDTRISYNIEVAVSNYYTAYDGDYYLDSFTPSYVYITFDNVTSVTKLPSFENNMVFKSAKWETVNVEGIPKFRLILELRQAGIYSGNGAYYNDEGDLMLTFPITTNVLSNYTIVIDPGHGYGKYEGVLDPGAIGHVTEWEANIGVAMQLEEQLAALGVNVIRLETEKRLYITAQRPIYARQYGCDMFIAIHSNKTPADDTARGTEVYYFTPFSQPLASAISTNVASYFTNNVYADGANKNRGSKYSYYWVTLQQDFPSVLIEMGFVSNLEDAMALADSTHQAGIAAGIVAGIKDYISRSNVSYAISGDTIVDVMRPEETLPATEVTVPDETTTPETSDVTEETTTTETSDITEETTAAETSNIAEETTAIETDNEIEETIENDDNAPTEDIEPE